VKYSNKQLKLVDDIVGLAKKLRQHKKKLNKAKNKIKTAHETWGSSY
jgi:hypothetical protein